MATGTPTLDRAPVEYREPASGRRAGGTPIELAQLQPGDTARLWRDVDAILRRSLGEHRLSDPLSSLLDTGNEPLPQRGWRRVAPSIIVSNEEYERRFSGIDLELFRASMPPAVFDAFVRHLGVIDGSDQLDIVDLTLPPDDWA